MTPELSRINQRFINWILAGLALTPLLGMSLASIFALQPLRQTALSLLPLFILGLLLMASRYFRAWLKPFNDWLADASEARTTPDRLHRYLLAFPRAYWGFFLLYALASPLLALIPLQGPYRLPDTPLLLNLMLIQTASAVLVGLPGYLRALDELGHLTSRLGLAEVQVSLKSKIRLLGGFLPVMGYALLLHYQYLSHGSLEPQQLFLWALLVLSTVAVTHYAIRSISQSLQPVEDVLARSGASTYEELTRLRPQSTDEIGYLTQTLGRLFRRLGDQESHMRAVVDTAAEGIIVVDDKGAIDTFNPAAEQLFGFLAAEIRGKPLGWLLPQLVQNDHTPPLTQHELETTGLHRNGKPLPVSVRVSDMRLRERHMFTCLVADVTKRKQAEDQLMNAEARYRDLVETAHDLVWSMDPEGHWTYLNGASIPIYGQAPNEMIGRHLREFQTAENLERDAEAFRRILAGEELVQYETQHIDHQGQPHHLSFNARAHFDDAGQIIHISGTARDISEQKAFQKQLAYQAEHDSLTGLFNRHYFQQELQRTVARVARHGAECALFYVDLDQFKYINDTLGHAAGDQLLVEISNMLLAHVRDGDLLSRFGGDEFTLLVYDVGRDQTLKVGENFRQLFEDYTFYYDGKSFNVTSSIGCAIIDHYVESADEVLSHADLACNMAKTHGRNRVQLYDPDDSRKAGMAEDMGWAARVREMLEHDRFQLVYQPIVCVETGHIDNYEVLVRMVCDDGQIILPGGFMPAAERFGLIHSVDRWIVTRAIRQLAEHHRKGGMVGFSINLSGKAFEDELLLPTIQQLLEETQLDPSWLTFEITETAAIANLTAAETFISALKDIGCQFALDDFGSGFSSFSYLKHLPVDKLKIDGSFVQALARESVDQAMVQSMNQVAHALGKKTVAEYVEDETSLTLLRSYGVDFAQGNHIGKPREVLVNLALPPQDNITRLTQ